MYGLGANAFDIDAVLRIFEYKGRPLTDPLIVHVPDIQAASQLFDFSTVPPSSPSASSSSQPLSSSATATTGPSITPLHIFHILGESFWPGPLTIVAKGISTIPDKVMANTGYVGVRVPANRIAQRLLQATQLPIAAPSANRFGHVSPTKASHVIDDLGHHPIGVVLSEYDSMDISNSLSTPSTLNSVDSVESTAAIGIESTVLKIHTEIHNHNPIVTLIILRRGGISMQEIENCIYNVHKYSKEQVLIKLKSSAGIVPLSVLPSNIYTHTNISGNSAALIEQSKHHIDSVSTTGQESQGMEAPGMLLTHYAPDIETFLVTSVTPSTTHTDGGNPNHTHTFTLYHNELQKTIQLDASTTVIIDFGGLLVSYNDKCIAYSDLSVSSTIMEARRIVFDRLRWAENVPNAKAVLLVDPIQSKTVCNNDPLNTDAQHGDALRDRMYRAASGKEVTFLQ